MASPIKSSSSTGSNSSPAISPALSDMMNRMNSQNSAFDGETSMQAFSSWLQKHALGADEQGSAPKPADGTPNPASRLSDSQLSATREAQQALARVRQQNAVNNKLPASSNADGSANAPQAKQDQPSNNEVDPNEAPVTQPVTGKTVASKTDRADKGSDSKRSGDAKKDDEVSFKTPTGDGVALVRELTPPPTIQPGDAAGMMAWLAGLTNGDLSHAGGKVVDLGTNDTGATQGTTAGLSADGSDRLGDLLLAGKHGAQDAAGALGLDPSLWQAASSAGQQTESLLAQFVKGGSQRDETDALASLVSGGALKGASFNELMAANTQGIRHESATLGAPFGSSDFAQALAEKVSMWVSSAKTDGPMTAELHLNPAEMGPINVKISLDGQSAQVDFAAAALETRKAIEASLPMLSSALSDVGLSLTGGGVSSQTSQQAFAQAQGQGAGSGSGAPVSGDDGDAGVESVRAVSAPRPGRAGGLDLYA